MQPHSRRGSKWRRFTHKYGTLLFVVLSTIAAAALVAFLMYMLTSLKWRARS